MEIKFRVASDSMQPALRVGDELELESLTKPLEIFDIIVFERHGSLTAHFVWRIQDESKTVVTRSLRAPRIDEEPVGFDQILGRVRNVKIKRFRRFLIAANNILMGSL